MLMFYFVIIHLMLPSNLLSRLPIASLLYVFFSWRYNPHWGGVFYSPLAGFSLLACEVS